MQIRHNPGVGRSPSFVGAAVSQKRHMLCQVRSKGRISSMRLRLEAVLTAVASCAVACALLWPDARSAGALLAAQDDPAKLSDLRLSSALRNSPDLIVRNIEAALAAGDADLAGRFVDLAAASKGALPQGLSGRVSDAVAEENSPSHRAKRFAAGLVSGEADDIASLSGA